MSSNQSRDAKKMLDVILKNYESLTHLQIMNCLVQLFQVCNNILCIKMCVSIQKITLQLEFISLSIYCLLLDKFSKLFLLGAAWYPMQSY